MNNLHPNQEMILNFLLDKSEGATLTELSEHLGITKTAAKEHLLKVEKMGFISFKDTKGKVGRPRRHYFLSENGHETFPRQYSWLSIVLLTHLTKKLGGKGMSGMMKELAVSVASSMKGRFENLSSKELLKEVTSVMSELGYRARLKQSDLRKGAVIEANNCVYHTVAISHPELCNFDTEFLKIATGMDVKLECCIAKGGEICRFKLIDKTSPEFPRR